MIYDNGIINETFKIENGLKNGLKNGKMYTYLLNNRKTSELEW